MNRSLTIPVLLVLVMALPLSVGGCGVPSGPNPGGGDNGGNGGSGNGDGNGGSDGGGNGGSGGEVEPVSGDYNPASSLLLTADGLQLLIPAGATLTPTTVTILPASEVASPGAIPGAVDLAGGQFGPNGLQFLKPVEVTTALLAPTAATALPVITFNDSSKRWVGTGGLGTVAPEGDEVTFPLAHFSIAGVPDPLPFPVRGGAVPGLVTIPNNGTFLSTEISSQTASLTYSASVGGSLEIDIVSETVNDAGQPQIIFMHLSGVRLTVVDDYVVAEIGGAGSVFDTGDFRAPDEPLVGTVVLSISGSTVNATVFVASTQRVIFGTLAGTAG